MFSSSVILAALLAWGCGGVVPSPAPEPRSPAAAEPVASSEPETEAELMARLDPNGLLSQPEPSTEPTPAVAVMEPDAAARPADVPPPSERPTITCRQRHSASTRVRPVRPREIERRVHGSLGCVVLLEYYAAWCPACREAMPQVSAVAERWRPHGLAVHAFATSDSGPQLDALVEAIRPAYEPLRLEPYENNEVADAIGRLGGSYPGSIPYFALFDTQGHLLLEGSGSGVLHRIEARLPELLD
jgi:thiol-disulfide isomerase/thioredoxin